MPLPFSLSKIKRIAYQSALLFSFSFFFFLYPHFFFDIEREKSLPQHVKQCAGEIKLCYRNMLSDTKFI